MAHCQISKRNRGHVASELAGQRGHTNLKFCGCPIDNTDEVFEALEKVFRPVLSDISSFQFRNMKQKLHRLVMLTCQS